MSSEDAAGSVDQTGTGDLNSLETSPISTENLLDEIHRLAEGDSPPTYKQMNAEGVYGANTYVRRFGSWNEAVREAGFEPNRRGKRVTTEALIDELQRLAEDGVAPSRSEMNKRGKYSPSTVWDRFGSWGSAAEAAGLECRQIHVSQGTPDEELLDEIRRLADGTTPPRTGDMRDRGKFSRDIYINRFGSWNKAVQEAGFSPRHHRIDIEEILFDVCVGRDAIGEWPSSDEYRLFGEYAYTTLLNRIGGWDAVIEAAEGYWAHRYAESGGESA